MGKSLGPATALMGRLKYPYRFALITFLFLIPIALLLYSFLAEIGRQADVSQRERDGVAYLQPLTNLYGHANKAHLVSLAIQRGVITSGAELETAETQIDRDLDALLKADGKYGANLQTGARAKALKADWEAIKSNSQDPAYNSKLAHFADDAADLITHVGNTSNIVVDPDLDTYYIQDMIMRVLPKEQSLVVEAASLGSSVVANRNASPEDRAQLGLLAGLIKDATGEAEENANTAFANNAAGNLKPRLETPLGEHVSASDAFSSLLDTELVSKPEITLAADVWLGAANRALDSNYNLQSSALQPFDNLLAKRIEGFGARRTLTVAFTMAALLLVVYLWAGFYLAVRRTASTLEKAGKLLESGGTAEGLALDGKDELSRIAAASLSKIASAANELNTTIDERTRELTEVAAVLAHHHDGIVVTDERGVIKVLNGAATQMLYTNFDLAVGRSLVELTRDPRVQEVLRAAYITPGQHQAIDLSLGNRVVLMVAKFIQIGDNQQTGLITMQDVTEVRKLQRVGQTGAMAMVR